MSDADKTQWGPMPADFRARLARRLASRSDIQELYAQRVAETAATERESA